MHLFRYIVPEITFSRDFALNEVSIVYIRGVLLQVDCRRSANPTSQQVLCLILDFSFRPRCHISSKTGELCALNQLGVKNL